MAVNVDLPAMGESITEAVLLEWLKHDGERVEADEPLCVLETDKANVELPTPAAGVLHLCKQAGETVRVGETLAQIEATDAAPRRQEPPRQPATAPTGDTGFPADGEAATLPLEDFRPAVRRLLVEHELDPAAIRGTGRRGQLTKEDVLAALQERQEPPEQTPTPAAAAPVAPADIEPARTPHTYDEQGMKRVPMSKIRQRIAERLVTAQHTAAMLTTFNEIDMTAVLEMRTRHGERFHSRHGVTLGLMSFFARASVLALQAFPVVNASIDGDDVVYHEYVHLGIAVSTERGLVVPVLQHADALSLARLETEIQRLATAAREGKLSPQDLSGGTFTISNGGVFGSLLSTPILTPPQSGILGMHTIQKRPVVVHDRMAIRPMMYVALTYDHRLIDGREAVLFLVRIKELLEEPARLLLEI